MERPIRSHDPCLCGNRIPEKFRYYINSSDDFIGQYCTVCRKEWLESDYVSDNSSFDTPDAPMNGTKYFFVRNPPELEEIRAFQIQSARTKIDLKHFGEVIKEGDHIAWHRKFGYWHHAIVSGINLRGNQINVIEWTWKDGRIQIVEDSLPVEVDEDPWFNHMYRLDYSDDITKKNDRELVLARARSRISDTGYSFFFDNCESFATYCKTGCEKSHQLAYLLGKMMEHLVETGVSTVKAAVKGGCKKAVSNILKAVPSAAGEVVPAEVTEKILKLETAQAYCDWVGVGIVILVEGGFVIWDMSKAYVERKNGKTSRNDFMEAAIRRVVEGVFTAGFAATAGFCVGGIVGGILAGIFAGAAGKVIGTWLGSCTGKALSSFFVDDRAVTKIEDLKPGDQIVLCGWCLHPRCHAIVVNHDGEDVITVIRNTYEKGVVEERLRFSKITQNDQPLFRVEYKKGTFYDPERVIRNARSKLGEKNYNLALYNCKSFARECKQIPNAK